MVTIYAIAPDSSVWHVTCSETRAKAETAARWKVAEHLKGDSGWGWSASDFSYITPDEAATFIPPELAKGKE